MNYNVWTIYKEKRSIKAFRNPRENSAEMSFNQGRKYHYGVPGEKLQANGKTAKQYYDEAIKMFDDKQNQAFVQFQCGSLLHYGANQLNADGKEAEKYYQAACDGLESSDRGYARMEIGKLYQFGAQGVPIDGKKAKKLYDQAFEEFKIIDRGEIQYQIGELMRNGAGKGASGLKKDAQAADTCYKEAVRYGFIKAYKRLYELYREGPGVVIADEKQARFYEKLWLEALEEPDAGKPEEDLDDERTDEIPDIVEGGWTYHVFISHAGEQKKELAMPLKTALEMKGFKAFLDKEDLRASGHTNEQQIFKALRESNVILFILSKDFASKKWPMRELLEALKLRSKESDPNRGPILIPLFYKLSVQECQNHGLPFNNYHLFEKNGFFERDKKGTFKQADVLKALNNVTKYVGVDKKESKDITQYLDATVAQVKISADLSSAHNDY